ncbi:hypothetical protein J4E86_010066 [Alternaria arbusti]|uniref:uncharacterized protein n=1 Tax=Alternaria arbusti TaxID=232088 RepID=UPI00221ED630|nr:uncharacterized protein J4E86_010066 [Alternaria arbusti]KAI4943119.1 hypothetical protein J4E86_010066 [Alternaria arbusti]
MSSFVQAYKIDQSCDAKGVTVDVRNAMTSAFEMVSAAYETLTQPPLSSDAQDLVGFLFAREGANPAQLLQQGKLEKTITLLRNIRTYMSTEVTGDATVSASDVIIFCHYDRWVQLEGHKDLWEDTRRRLITTILDAYSLLDKVLLHEMTHARGAFQEWTKKGVVEGIKDVLTPNVILRPFNWAAYGWEGVGKLARKGGELNTPGGPDNNADTIALFGSGT